MYFERCLNGTPLVNYCLKQFQNVNVVFTTNNWTSTIMLWIAYNSRTLAVLIASSSDQYMLIFNEHTAKLYVYRILVKLVYGYKFHYSKFLILGYLDLYAVPIYCLINDAVSTPAIQGALHTHTR